MSNESSLKVKKKSGRTPEQQAARDARKTAKPLIIPPSPPAESSTSLPSPRPSPRPDSRKRQRVQEGDEDFLEIDVAAPEPLSKADARAARKKAKKGEGTEVEKKEDQSGAPGTGEPRKKNSVWIGNLSFRTTPVLLRDWLQSGVTELGGTGEGCVTRIHLPKTPGKGEFSGNKG